MENRAKLEWMASFAAALSASDVPGETIEAVAEPMWKAAGLLDPEQAASEYTSMLVVAGMNERRRAWRGWPSGNTGNSPLNEEDSVPLP